LIPAPPVYHPSTLVFRYNGQSFDTTDTGPSIHDAVEAALADANGNPLVAPFTTSRDAFFTLSEGQAAALGTGVSLANGVVTVDISQLVPGSTYTFVLRLVNNDHDTNSTIRLISAGSAPTLTSVPSLSGNEGASLPFSGAFTGVSGDSYTATINWGDNSTSTGTVSFSGTSGTVTGSHTYAAAGTYTLLLTDHTRGTQLFSKRAGSARRSPAGLPTDTVR
jgi:hypothetical protein